MKKRELLAQYLYFPSYLRILLILAFVLLSSGVLIRFLEPHTFKSLLDAIYWSIVTTATVGYGDLVPKTTLGKIMTMILILFGSGFVLFLFTQMAGYTVQRQNHLMEGKINFTGEGHIIIIGWNERSKRIILELQQKGNTSEIVLIDSTLTTNPYLEKNIHFIKGEPYDDAILKIANVQNAKKAIITADHNLVSELQADMTSILILLAMKGLNSNIYITVEILTEGQLINARRAGADRIIETSSLISNALFQ